MAVDTGRQARPHYINSKLIRGEQVPLDSCVQHISNMICSWALVSSHPNTSFEKKKTLKDKGMNTTQDSHLGWFGVVEVPPCARGGLLVSLS